MLNSALVYQGFFIDHSEGDIARRYLLTLRDSHGGYLNNVLTFFLTTIVATASWSIVSFLLHQLGNHTTARDGQRRLVEIALRNVSNSFVVLLGIPVIWKTRSSVSFKSTFFNLFIVFTALFHWIAWFAASVLISKIELNSVFLAASRDCGYREPISEDIAACRTFHANKASVARNYVASCANGQHASGCMNFIASYFPISQVHSFPCPFGTSLCPPGNNTAFRIQTDPISSFEIGLNLPDGYFSVKRRMTCSPIRIQNGTTSGTHSLNNNLIIGYYFGKTGNDSDPELGDPSLIWNRADPVVSGNYYVE